MKKIISILLGAAIISSSSVVTFAEDSTNDVQINALSAYTSKLCTINSTITDLPENVTADELADSVTNAVSGVSVQNAEGAEISGKTPVTKGCVLIIDGNRFVIGELIRNSFESPYGFFSGSQKFDIKYNSNAGSPSFKENSYAQTGVKKLGDPFYVFDPDQSRTTWDAYMALSDAYSNTRYCMASFDFMIQNSSEVIGTNTNVWNEKSNPSSGSNSLGSTNKDAYQAIDPFLISSTDGVVVPAASISGVDTDVKIADIDVGKWYHFAIEIESDDTYSSGTITSKPLVTIYLNNRTYSYYMDLVSPGIRNLRLAPTKGTKVNFDNIFSYTVQETGTIAHKYKPSMFKYATFSVKYGSSYSIFSNVIRGIKKNSTSVGEVLAQLNVSDDATSVKVFNDTACTKEAKDDDMVTNNTVFVIGSKGGFNIETLYNYYTPEQPSSASDFKVNADWTDDNGYYYGYGDITAAQVKEKVVADVNATVQVIAKDGATELADSDIIERGASIIVTSENGKSKTKKIFGDAKCRLLEPICTVNGLNADKSLADDASLDVSLNVDCFYPDEKNEYALILSEYDGSELLDCRVTPFKATTAGTSTISTTLPLKNGNDISYKVMVWDSMSNTVPLKMTTTLTNKLAGKTIAFFGDSITGLWDPGYPGYVQDLIGVEAINCGINGTTVADMTDDAHKYYSIAYRIRALLDTSIDRQPMIDYAKNNTSDTTLQHLQNGLNLDISQLDAITMLYGTNDFTYCNPLENVNDPKDTTTIKGSIRYTVEQLHAANPDMKIIIFLPFYRDRQTKTSDTVTDRKNSDDYTNTIGLYVRDYGNAIKEAADEYDYVDCYDLYELSGVDRYNYQKYLYDGLHFSNPDGLKMIASKLSDCIIKSFN
ncbi:MAG: SGNH/GDSL hydrolase family protein [Firmicutes bacterium]|nr:SGNH/GDSL hydrolase family protein [Bacillota bacterium]